MVLRGIPSWLPIPPPVGNSMPRPSERPKRAQALLALSGSRSPERRYQVPACLDVSFKEQKSSLQCARERHFSCHSG